MSDIDVFKQQLQRLTTASIFPKMYKGFKEIENLIKSEDALLAVLKNCVTNALSDKLVTEMNEVRLAVFEQMFGLSQAGSIDTRRARVIAFINRSKTINDASILARARDAAGTNDLIINTDAATMTSQIEPTSEDVTFEQLLDALRELEPIVPQAILLNAVMEATKTLSVNAYGALFVVETVNLGLARLPNRRVYIAGLPNTGYAVVTPNSNDWQTIDVF